VQITQLRSLISAAVHSERVDYQHPPVPVERSLLSPVTPQPESQSSSRTIQTGLQNTPINPMTNVSTGAEQHGWSIINTWPQSPIGQFGWNAGTSSPAHNLPPLRKKKKTYSGSPNVSTLILLIYWLTNYPLIHL